MKKTAKKMTNNSKKKLFKIVAIVLIAVALVPVAISVMNNLQTRQAQIDRLERASEDLRGLYEKIVVKLDANLSPEQFEKKCWQASAKFSNGTIRCGSQGTIVLNGTLSTAEMSTTVEQAVQQSEGFTYTSTDIMDNEKDKSQSSFWVHFSHSGTECYSLDGIEDNQKVIIVSCLETVPDFLPGYDKEQ